MPFEYLDWTEGCDVIRSFISIKGIVDRFISLTCTALEGIVILNSLVVTNNEQVWTYKTTRATIASYMQCIFNLGNRNNLQNGNTMNHFREDFLI